MERHEVPGARREHVLRVPVRGRDDGAAGSQCKRQRAGGDLLATRVRSQEDIGLAEEKRELVDREEAIVEHDVGPEPELEGALLEHESIPLALSALHVGMRAAGDRVHEVRIPLDDRRKSLDHGLDPLPGRDEAERRETEAVAAVGPAT